MEPWVSFGFFVTGVGSLLTNLVLGLRGASKSDGDLSLAKLKTIIDAQGSWIGEQAEQIVGLKHTADQLQVRVVATETHARACDERVDNLDRFIRAQGLTPP